MKERYKYEFMKYIYNKLGLNLLEEQIIDYGVSAVDDNIEGLYKDISKYFSLVNNVDESGLPHDMREKYDYYFSMTSDDISANNLQEEVYDFLESSYKHLLYPNISQNFCFYGSLNYKYIAPRDSIVLGFHYREFDLDDKNFDELYLKQDGFVSDMLNNIQDDLSEKTGLNIAVLKYNEYSKAKYK